MNKHFLALIILVFVFSNQYLKAQNDQPIIIDRSNTQTNVIKLTPIALLKGQLVVVSYERVLKNQFTGQLGLAPIIFPSMIGTMKYPLTGRFYSNVAIEPELRFYFNSDNVMDDFYIGLYHSNRRSAWQSQGVYYNNEVIDALELEGYAIDAINFLFQGYELINLDIKFNRYDYGMLIGAQKVLGRHFTLDFFTGIGTNSSKFRISSNDNNYKDTFNVKTISFRFNVAFGWRFGS